MKSLYNTQPDVVQLYAGERISSVFGTSYFVKGPSLVHISDAGEQTILYTHELPIESFAFAASQRLFGFISQGKLNLLSLQTLQVVQSYTFTIAASHISFSPDCQLLLVITPMAQNQLLVYRLLQESEPFLLTRTILEAPSVIDFDIEKSFESGLKRQTPWITAEFVTNQSAIIISKESVFCIQIVMRSQYVIALQHKVGNIKKLTSVQEAEKYLVRNLYDLKRGEEFQDQFENDLRELMNQTFGENLVVKQQSTILFNLDENLKVQQIFDSIQKPIVEKQDTILLKETKLLQNVATFLDNKIQIQNNFTGQYSICNDVALVVCRNFGVLCFKIGENANSTFGYLDLDYQNVQQHEGDLSDEHIGLKQPIGQHSNKIELGPEFEGDRRLLSIATSNIVIQQQIQILLGFQDSSVKYYNLKIEEVQLDQYEEYPQKPILKQYYPQFGPVIRLQSILIDAQSILFGVVQTNKMIICQFAEQLCYMLQNCHEQSDRLKITDPLFITSILQESHVHGQNMRRQHTVSMIKYKIALKKDPNENELQRQVRRQSIGKISDVISLYILNLLSSNANITIKADQFSFLGDENKIISMFGTLDGRIYTNYGNQQKFITARHPINLFDDQWLLPDPVTQMEFIQQVKVLVTGHASGYIRFYQVSNVGELKMINRIKISDLPIINICASPDCQMMMISDSSFTCFYLAGIQKDSLILGYFNVTSLPNLSPFDQNQNFALANITNNEYVKKQLEKIVYNQIELEKQLNDNKQTQSIQQDLMDVSKFSIMNKSKKVAEEQSVPARLILGGEKKTEENMEKLASQIKPLSHLFSDSALKCFNHIVKIVCSRESFFIALSTGDVVKIAYPSPERIMQATDQGSVVTQAEFLVKLAQSTEYELQQYETKFYSVPKLQLMDQAELQPIVLHTGFPLSTIYIDQCAVPPPCVVCDFVYCGLVDGRILVYQMKSAHEKSVQQPTQIKIDPPLSQNAILTFKYAIQSIKIQQNVLIASDRQHVVITLPVAANQLYLKRIGASLLKQDDIIPMLPSNELVVASVNLKQQYTGAVRVASGSNFFIQTHQTIKKFVNLIKLDAVYMLAVITENAERYNIQLPTEVFTQATDLANQIDNASKSFVTQSLQQQALEGSQQIQKQQLKTASDMRVANRLFQMVLSEQQTLMQLIQTIIPFNDKPFQHEHPFCSHISQHFVKRMTVEGSMFIEKGKIEAVKKEDLMNYDIKDNVQHQEQQKKQILARIALLPLSCGLECCYQQAIKLAALVVTSQLRIKQNSALVEESVKICEIAKDLEKQNEQVLQDSGLQVLPSQSSLLFLKTKDSMTSNQQIDYQDITKVLASTTRIHEQELRISESVSNTTRFSLLQQAAQYEKAFKADLLGAKAFLSSICSDRIQSAEEKAAGEAVCGLQNRKIFVGSVPQPQSSAQTLKRARKIAMLRSTQIVAERVSVYLPPALMRTAEGAWVLPNEAELNKQNMNRQASIAHLQPTVEPTEEAFEQQPLGDDPFNTLSHESGIPSGSLLKILNLQAPTGLRNMKVPFIDPPKFEKAPKLIKLIEKVPPVRRFMTTGLSMRKALFADTEVAFSVRAMQQMLLLQAINLLLVKDTNAKISKVKDAKFRTVQKIQETVQQLKDIGKELTYHAKEQTMTEMIEQLRKKLFSEAQANGVAIEECAERAAKNAPQMLTDDDAIAEKAMLLLPLDLLDLATVAGYQSSGSMDQTESLKDAVGFNVYGASEAQGKVITNELRKCASQCTLEKFAQIVQQFAGEIKSGVQNQQIQSALLTLSDEGLFKVEHLETYFSKTQAIINNTNQQVAPEVLKIAQAYKRALYDMMRGSIDAGNKVSIRDLPIPSSFGLQSRSSKLSKEQEQQIDAYLAKLKEIEENRIKEQKRLVAMAQKLREQAAELATVFDNTTLKQLRDRRFNAEIKIQAIQLNCCTLVQRQLQRQKQLQLLSEKQGLGRHFTQLSNSFTHYKQFINELRQKIHDSVNSTQEILNNLNQQIERTSSDLKMRDLLKKNVNAQLLIQNLRQTLHSEARNKIQQGIFSQVKTMEPIFRKVLDDFYSNQVTSMYGDGTTQQFKEVSDNTKQILDLFFQRLNLQGTFEKSCFAAAFNDSIFPDGIYPDVFLKKANSASKQLLYPLYVNIPYFVLFTKLIPLETVQEFADLKVTGQKAQVLTQNFDVFRAMKAVCSIALYQQKEKLSAIDTFYNQLEDYQQKIEHCSKYVTKDDEDQLKQLFSNTANLILLKEGQVEYTRPYEALNDQQLIKYDVDADGNVLSHTQPNQVEVDQNTDIIMRNDGQYVLLDKDYVVHEINDALRLRGKELVGKLEDIAKVHQKIKSLQLEIALTQQRTDDYIAQAKDFQMIRVSKEMLDIIRTNTSTENRKTQEVKAIMNKLEHTRKSQQQQIVEREIHMAKIPSELQTIEYQNKILIQKIEELDAKNAQREQAIPDFEEEEGAENILEEFSLEALLNKYEKRGVKKTLNKTETMKAEENEVDKKFRRIAALRKMRELSKAQEEEMQFLINELDKLRKKTYPSFE